MECHVIVRDRNDSWLQATATNIPGDAVWDFADNTNTFRWNVSFFEPIGANTVDVYAVDYGLPAMSVTGQFVVAVVPESVSVLFIILIVAGYFRTNLNFIG